MIPQSPSAARISEYVCDLEYLFSRMNVGSYGPTEPHLWLVGKIPLRTWEDCRSTSERKRRIHTYDDLVDLLIEPALQRRNSSRGTWGKVPTSTLIVVSREGPKPLLTRARVEVKGGGVTYVP